MGKDKQQPRIGDIRKIAEEYFIRHGRRLTFRQALLYYRNNGGQYVPSGSFVKPDDFLPDNAFVKYIDNGIIFQADQIVQSGYTGKIYGKEPVPLRIRENDFINKEEDIAVYIHVPYINDGLHSHDHFEINYVYKGTGYFSFSRNGKEWRRKSCWNPPIFPLAGSARLSVTHRLNISAGSLKRSIRYRLQIIAKVLTFPAEMRKVLKKRRTKGIKIAYLSLHNA